MWGARRRINVWEITKKPLQYKQKGWLRGPETGEDRVGIRKSSLNAKSRNRLSPVTGCGRIWKGRAHVSCRFCRPMPGVLTSLRESESESLGKGHTDSMPYLFHLEHMLVPSPPEIIICRSAGPADKNQAKPGLDESDDALITSSGLTPSLVVMVSKNWGLSPGHVPCRVPDTYCHAHIWRPRPTDTWLTRAIMREGMNWTHMSLKSK